MRLRIDRSAGWERTRANSTPLLLEPTQLLGGPTGSFALSFPPDICCAPGSSVGDLFCDVPVSNHFDATILLPFGLVVAQATPLHQPPTGFGHPAEMHRGNSPPPAVSRTPVQNNLIRSQWLIQQLALAVESALEDSEGAAEPALEASDAPAPAPLGLGFDEAWVRATRIRTTRGGMPALEGTVATTAKDGAPQL